MPWHPLPRMAFAVAVYPFQASAPADLPLELGDELYIIEQGGLDGAWYRGYLVAPPSLLAGLTSVKGQTLEARVFSGIFPRNCVEIRELLADPGFANGVPDHLLADDHLDEIAASTRPDSSTPSGVGDGLAATGASDGASDDPRAPTPSRSARARPGSSTALSRKEADQRRDRALKEGLARAARLTPTSAGPGASPARDPNAPKPPAPVPMLKVGDETPTSADEPLVDEIASCLREWHSTNLHDLFLSRRYRLLDRIARLVRQLDLARRQLLHDVLTRHELDALREKVVWDLVTGNKSLSAGVVVRDPAHRGRIMTGDDSIIDITRLQSMMSLLNQPPVPALEASTLHHLLIDVKGLEATAAEPVSLRFYLVVRQPAEPAQPVTETYAVDVPLGRSGSLGRLAGLSTLFTDLSGADVGEKPAGLADLYLVVRVVSIHAQPPTAAQAAASAGKPPSRDGQANHRSHAPSASFGLAGGLAGTLKSGRRSLMWGPKNLTGSLSARSLHSSAHSLSSREPDSAPSLDGDSTLASDSGLVRPGSQSSAHSTAADARLQRVVGLGVMRLTELMRQPDPADHVLPIWTGDPAADDRPASAAADGQLLDELLPCLGVRPGTAGHVKRLRLSATPFVSPDVDSLVKKTPTRLQGVHQTKKIGFSGAPTKLRSDIYLTLSDALLPRHALLSHPRAGSTALQTGSDLSSLQVTVAVCRRSGERVERCIFPTSNEPGLTTWQSTAVRRDQPWQQIVRLALPDDLVPQCHLTLTLADAPGPAFAIAWMPLWDQHAFLRDGHYALTLYRLDELTATPTLLTSSERGGYLTLAWNARGKDDASKDEAVTGPMALLRVRTYLCSTIFSQDQALLGLLKWRERAPEDVLDILARVAFVPEIEIVKLLDDVFDALFAILVEQAGNDDYEDLVFAALVTVLGIVHDRRFDLGPLVDQYATSRFNYPFAAPCLTRSFARLLADPTDSESSRKLRATFKVGRHIFKFIVQAREQQRAKEAGIGITTTQPNFTRELQSIFKGLESLMTKVAPILVGSQTLAVQHFHTWLPELIGFVAADEIAQIAFDFVDCCANVKGKLVLYKLVLIIHYSHLSIFDEPPSRPMLFAKTVDWLAPYWGKAERVTDQWRDQVRLCCSVLAAQMPGLAPHVPDYIPRINDAYRVLQAAPRSKKEQLSLLFPTAYPFVAKPVAAGADFDEAMIELSAIMAALSRLPGGITVKLPQHELADFLVGALQVHTSILDGDAFPRDWISVHIYHHQSSIKVLEHIGRLFIDSFLPEPDEAESFNTELWLAFFTTLLKLVGSDALALETFPQQKRRAVWKIAGDVREQGADLLRRTWNAIGWETSPEDRERWGLSRLGGYQVQYVPGLVAPIVELCLSVHGGLRKVAVEVLHTMVMSEWTLNQDLAAVQAEMIECLDRLFKSKHLSESILQKLFISEMIDLLEPLSRQPDDELYRAARGLISTIDDFLDMLVAVHSTEMSGEVSHIIHTLRLMDFLRDMQKEDISIRYVHQLAQIQAQARNLTEAGLAIRLHADAYAWDTSRIEPAMTDPPYPSQTSFERREALYFEMIRYFEEGKSWENALATYKELADQYESNTYDYAKLARTQKAMAKVHEAIVRGERQPPRFFKVVYSGLGFPPSLRDKQFICEGSPSERLATFTDRMQQQHPSAQILSGGEVEDVEGQFLEIIAVTPHRDLYHPVYQRSRVLQPTREHLLSAWPRHFSVTTRRSASGGPVEEQWVDKILYTTAEAFPTILKRSEIVSTEEVRLTSVQTAIERTHRKTQELMALEKRVFEENTGKYSSLVEALALSVDPASELSVARYRSLIPELAEEAEDEEAEKEEKGKKEEGKDEKAEEDPLENALKMALLDHAVVVKRCLGSFRKSDDAQVRSLQEDLIYHFERTFEPELAMLTPPSQTVVQSPPTSPVPVSSRAGQRQAVPVETPSKASARPEPKSIDSVAEAVRPVTQEKNRLSLAFLKQSTNEIADLFNNFTSSNQNHEGEAVEGGSHSGLTGRRSRSKSTKRRSFIADGISMTPFSGGHHDADRSNLQSRGSHLSSIGGSQSYMNNGTNRHGIREEGEEELAPVTATTTTTTTTATEPDGHATGRRSRGQQAERSRGRHEGGGTSLRGQSSGVRTEEEVLEGPGGSQREQARPKTSSSSVFTVSSSVGSVRKRLSLLKIGRKHSKPSVRVDVVAEE